MFCRISKRFIALLLIFSLVAEPAACAGFAYPSIDAAASIQLKSNRFEQEALMLVPAAAVIIGAYGNGVSFSQMWHLLIPVIEAGLVSLSLNIPLVIWQKARRREEPASPGPPDEEKAITKDSDTRLESDPDLSLSPGHRQTAGELRRNLEGIRAAIQAGRPWEEISLWGREVESDLIRLKSMHAPFVRLLRSSRRLHGNNPLSQAQAIEIVNEIERQRVAFLESRRRSPRPTHAAAEPPSSPKSDSPALSSRRPKILLATFGDPRFALAARRLYAGSDIIVVDPHLRSGDRQRLASNPHMTVLNQNLRQWTIPREWRGQIFEIYVPFIQRSDLGDFNTAELNGEFLSVVHTLRDALEPGIGRIVFILDSDILAERLHQVLQSNGFYSLGKQVMGGRDIVKHFPLVTQSSHFRTYSHFLIVEAVREGRSEDGGGFWRDRLLNGLLFLAAAGSAWAARGMTIGLIALLATLTGAVVYGTHDSVGFSHVLKQLMLGLAIAAPLAAWESVGQIIRRHRQEKQWSHQKLADEFNSAGKNYPDVVKISPTRVGRIEIKGDLLRSPEVPVFEEVLDLNADPIWPETVKELREAIRLKEADPKTQKAHGPSPVLLATGEPSRPTPPKDTLRLPPLLANANRIVNYWQPEIRIVSSQSQTRYVRIDGFSPGIENEPSLIKTNSKSLVIPGEGQLGLEFVLNTTKWDSPKNLGRELDRLMKFWMKNHANEFGTIDQAWSLQDAKRFSRLLRCPPEIWDIIDRLRDRYPSYRGMYDSEIQFRLTLSPKVQELLGIPIGRFDLPYGQNISIRDLAAALAPDPTARLNLIFRVQGKILRIDQDATVLMAGTEIKVEKTRENPTLLYSFYLLAFGMAGIQNPIEWGYMGPIPALIDHYKILPLIYALVASLLISYVLVQVTAFLVTQVQAVAARIRRGSRSREDGGPPFGGTPLQSMRHILIGALRGGSPSIKILEELLRSSQAAEMFWVQVASLGFTPETIRFMVEPDFGEQREHYPNLTWTESETVHELRSTLRHSFEWITPRTMRVETNFWLDRIETNVIRLGRHFPALAALIQEIEAVKKKGIKFEPIQNTLRSIEAGLNEFLRERLVQAKHRSSSSAAAALNRDVAEADAPPKHIAVLTYGQSRLAVSIGLSNPNAQVLVLDGDVNGPDLTQFKNIPNVNVQPMPAHPWWLPVQSVGQVDKLYVPFIGPHLFTRGRLLDLAEKIWTLLRPDSGEAILFSRSSEFLEEVESILQQRHLASRGTAFLSGAELAERYPFAVSSDIYDRGQSYWLLVVTRPEVDEKSTGFRSRGLPLAAIFLAAASAAALAYFRPIAAPAALIAGVQFLFLPGRVPVSIRREMLRAA